MERSFGLKNATASSEAPIFEIALDSFTGILGIVCDALILYILITFKKLQNRVNEIISHWCTSDILFLLTAPLSTRLVSYLVETDTPRYAICILHEVQYAFLMMDVVFVALLAFDWYIINCTTSCATRYRSKYKTVITYLWIVPLPFFAPLFITTCANESIEAPVSAVCLAFAWLFLLIITVTFNCVKLCKMARGGGAVFQSNHTLIFSTIFAMAALMLFGYVFLESSEAILALDALDMVFTNCNSLIMVALLAFYDKHFWKCLVATLKCKRSVQFQGIASDNGHSEENHV